MRIGYLVSQYPSTSHTFIRREVNALRVHGLSVETFSVRRPTLQECCSARDRAAFEETYYLLPANPAALLVAHGKAFFTRPVSYLRVLCLALRHRVPGVRALLWTLFYFVESILLARELERRRIEHVHNHFANAGANVGLLASCFLQIPWSLTLHGISETDYPAGVLLRAKIEAAQFVACVSDFGRAQAMRVVPPEQWHKLFVARCGLNLSEMPSRAVLPPSAVGRVVCAGRLSPEKGHIGLLEAFAMVRARAIDADLTLIGDGPERARIEQYVRVLELQDRVVLLGRLDEEQTLARIAASDVLVLPSFMEGLPIVLMEAMALGVPVIATRVAGVPELISDEQQGLLFCPADWDELAERMARLLTDPPLRKRLGQAGRAKVEAQFEIGRTVEPLIARFTNVAAGSQDGRERRILRVTMSRDCLSRDGGNNKR
jgi:colanic acid/amylovoran biosynthesis glycosyltransferase